MHLFARLLLMNAIIFNGVVVSKKTNQNKQPTTNVHKTNLSDWEQGTNSL